MLFNKIKRVLPVVVLTALALAPMGAIRAASSDGNITLTSPLLQDTEPVTIYAANSNPIITLDPQQATDFTSINPIENLFLGLTDLDPKDTSVRAEAATEWTTNDAGDVWTFTLRDDIPWVRWDPATKKATEVRKVTAADFEYGIKRGCDPRMGSLYTNVAASMIKGCAAVASKDPGQIQDSDFDQIGVKALSDTQLEISTNGVLSYFESASGMWIFRAVPKEAIEEFGDKWTDPGNIITNGPFVIDEWDRNVTAVFMKNPLYPEDINDNYGGNIERYNIIYVQDSGTVYSLYQNNEVDSSGVPSAELNRIRSDETLSKELYQTSQLTVSYFGFAFDKEPFDKAEVRRAFSAVIDRNAFVSEILQGLGVPMAHFMPPGIRGAVAVNEIGIGDPSNLGFDPEYAKAQMEAAGYPNCEGLPEITILATDRVTPQFLQDAVQTHLGCDASKITIENAEFAVLLKQIQPNNPTPQRPHMWTLAWGPDYPDAQNWIHDVLSCKAENDFKRPCGPIDEKIDAASQELDPQKRDQMYRELEEAFFGPEGEFPIIPVWLDISIGLVKPWYKGFFDTDGLFGGAHWNTRSIDQAAQLEARPKQ
jgi:oligopeptide transport system substrate-binding protein